MSNRRPPKEDKAEISAEWMNTYADMVTLLFAFFVLLFAMSQIDVQKFNLLVSVLSSKGADPTLIMDVGNPNEMEVNMDDPTIPGIEGEVDPAIADIAQQIKEIIQKSGAADKVTIDSGEDYIFIRFMDDMLFAPNSSTIRQEDYELLYFIGMALRSIQDDVGSIRVDGHTAAVPEMDNYPVSDRDLSSARANAVVKYLEDEVGIKGDLLSSYAFGKYKPFADNSTEEGRAKNRRIELWITKTNDIGDKLDNIYEKMHE